jgi:putative acetyltransferase
MMQIRPEGSGDRAAIRRTVEAAFDQTLEPDLVDRLRADGDLVLSLIAHDGQECLGHIGFSRIVIRSAATDFPAVSLAPLAVLPSHQRSGIGSGLVEAGHARLKAAGERLVIVLGDPVYYTRFGYTRTNAEGFESPYQCDALLALAFGDAPGRGRLVYPPAFDGLG